jgi:hypothetical protein
MSAWRVSTYSGSDGNCVEVSTALWRKSSYSGSSTECVEVGLAPWRKSSYSGSSGECVEVGAAPTAVVVRDTKVRDGARLAFSAQAWRSFAASLKRP